MTAEAYAPRSWTELERVAVDRRLTEAGSEKGHAFRGNQYVHVQGKNYSGTGNRSGKGAADNAAHEAAVLSELDAHTGMSRKDTIEHMTKVHKDPGIVMSTNPARTHAVYHKDDLARRAAPWDPWGEQSFADTHLPVVLTHVSPSKPVTIDGDHYKYKEAVVGKNQVLYRGIGDIKELMDAAQAGAWRSHGKFSKHGPEGVLQMAAKTKSIGLMPYRPFTQKSYDMGYSKDGKDGPLWQSGYKHVVAIDASGLHVRGLVNPQADGFEYPTVVAGLGAVKAIPLNRVLGIRDIGPGGAISKTDNTTLFKQFKRKAGL